MRVCHAYNMRARWVFRNRENSRCCCTHIRVKFVHKYALALIFITQHTLTYAADTGLHLFSALSAHLLMTNNQRAL